MKFGNMMFLVLALLAVAYTLARAGETPIYDKDGRYSGSVFDYGRTQTYTDRNGQFTGSAVSNGNGTTSFFNRNGNFSGSAGSFDRPGLQLQQEVTMRRTLLVVTAATALLTSSAHADQRFLRAAAFFLNGYDDPRFGLKADAAYGFEAMSSPTAVILQGKDKPCTVHFSNQLALPTLRTVDFNRMPGPRDFGYTRFGGGIGGPPQQSWFIDNLPADAMIETSVKKDENDIVSFVPTGRRWKELYNLGSRQLRALDFIRDNYCPGLPMRGF
jgi:hypothetical protein